MADSPVNAVLDALGLAVFTRDNSGELRLAANPPEWLRSVRPELTTIGSLLSEEQMSPFFENFLIDADNCWSTGASQRIRSGPWIERRADGKEVTLEATALNAGGQHILLIERQGEAFEAKRSMLQHARETVIAYQRLNSELQKKEILLSCIADEMNGALANAITSLRLLEMEQNPARFRQLLSLASRATEEQQGLINKVLRVFAGELEHLYGHEGEQTASASFADALKQARENVAPQFSEKQVRLSAELDGAGQSDVAMHREHLVRVLATLLENALQNSAKGDEVQLKAFDETDSVFVRVLDQGAPRPADVSRKLFQRMSDIENPDLPLHFCRVAVEHCRGELGYESLAERGNCFSVRLPKANK